MTRETTALADLPYRPCVGIALINRAGAVFVGHRKGLSDGPDVHAWQMPQGGIDADEGPEAAAVRELYEETNVSPAFLRPLGQIPDWLSYDLPAAVMKRAWKGCYRGQTQKWFAFGFLGTDAEIDVQHPAGGQHKAEFDAWRWAAFPELPGLIVPFKRPVYEAVVAAFAPLATWARGV